MKKLVFERLFFFLLIMSYHKIFGRGQAPTEPLSWYGTVLFVHLLKMKIECGLSFVCSARAVFGFVRFYWVALGCFELRWVG